MKGNIFELIKLISGNKKITFIYLLSLVIFCSLIEVLSIGSIVPLIAILLDKNSQTIYKSFFENYNLISLDSNFLVIAGLVFSMLILFSGLLRVYLLRLTNKFTFEIAIEISLKLYSDFLAQEYENFIDSTSSQLISIIVAKVNSVIYGFVMQFLNLLVSVVIGAAIIIGLAFISPGIMSIVFGSFMLIYTPILVTTRKRLASDSEKISTLSTKIIECIQDSFGSFREIVINDQQIAFINKFKTIDSSLRRAQGRVVFLSTYPRYLVEMIGMLVLVFVSFYYISIGEDFIVLMPILASVSLASQRLLPLFQQAYSAWSNIRMNQSALAEVIALVNHNKINTKNDLIETIVFNQSIEFKNVYFKYKNSSKNALENINIKILAGDRVGIFGKTGSGKSTFVDLLMGLIFPTSGEIYIDGKVLTKNMIRSWRSSFSHVPQSIYLFNDSIENNILMGCIKDNIRLQFAIKASQLEGMLAAIKHGLNFIVGERGSMLSGGERQRIGIARSLYRNNKILVLDEGTSALDSETERNIIDCLLLKEKEFINKTIILISHNIESLKECNNIIKIDHGKVFKL